MRQRNGYHAGRVHYGQLLGALLLALASCGAPEPTSPAIVYSPCGPLSVRAGGDTSSDELASIVAAAHDWNRFGLTQLGVADGGEQIPLVMQDAAEAFHGLYDDQRGEIYVNRRLTDFGERQVTIAHELGHAMGLPHVPAAERASLMNPGNLVLHPTDEDARVLAATWNGCAKP